MSGRRRHFYVKGHTTAMQVVLLVLLWALTQHDTWKLAFIVYVACLLARRMPFDGRGERITVLAGDNACQV